MQRADGESGMSIISANRDDFMKAVDDLEFWKAADAMQVFGSQ